MSEKYVPREYLANTEPEEEKKEDNEKSSSVLGRFGKAALLAGALLGSGAAKNEAESQIVPMPGAEIARGIKQGEFIVPAKVLKAFGAIVDSTSVDAPSAAYLSQNFLNGDREMRFKTELLGMGYSNQEINNFVDIFKNRNIIISDENDTRSPEFKIRRQHEWMHKLIDELSSKDRQALDEAVRFIVGEYEGKAMAADDSIVSKYKNASTRSEKDSLLKRKQEIFKDSDPVLYDVEGSEQSKTALNSLLKNSREFYPHLLSGNLNPKAEQVLRGKFPKAAEIYDKLKAQVEEITNK